MAILTTTKLGDKNTQPETQLDWAGRPFKPSQGEAYGGRPEHFSNAEKLRQARIAKAKLPMTPERLAKLREGMAKARAIGAALRAKRAKVKEA